MEELGRVLIVWGAVMLVVGILLVVGPSIPLLGRLPGDIRIERPGFQFYFPLTTSLLLSIVLSLVLTLLARWR